MTDRQLRSNVGKSQEIGSTESTVSREVCFSDGTIAPEISVSPATSVDSNATPLEQTPATTSRKGTIPKNLLRVKKDFARDICSLDKTFVEKKMTETKEYSIENAMALIPEYRGGVEELGLFVRQIDRVSRREMVNEEELLDIVLAKLKGEAVSHFQRIKAKSWEEMKELLLKEFGENCSVESIFYRTETLAQRQNETFRRYAERARHIVELVKAHASDNEGLIDYASRHIKHHFVTGLNDANLRVLALMQNTMKLEPLMDYLEQVHDNADRVTEAKRKGQE